MANYVIGEMSDEANIVVYDVPELSFTVEIDETLTKVIEEKCSGCSVSTADIQVATLGNTAPTTVVSDLQAHSDADLAVFTISEISIGRPAAGLEVETLSYVAGTSHLQYIKGGKETASLGYDIAIGSWMLVEMAAPPDRRLETLRRRGQRLRHDPVPSTDRSTSGPAWAGPEVPIGKGSRPACHSS